MTVVDKSRPTSHDIRQCWLGVQDPDKKDVPFLWLTTSAILVWKVIPKNRRRYLAPLSAQGQKSAEVAILLTSGDIPGRGCGRDSMSPEPLASTEALP
jgi:hypothetical protein